ncbi:hypothetical protein SLEP1_g47982 [Rubroshorea leprosula]|uniref:PGG domain-containing protein n=1 Tax=Rubroshorea leprosula TaxID=152421 RepID=A0AAV5LT42_9ROSI|nr:hypothetical protein SLEP1_g47982 [Rubroshorea leprosula]
MAMTLNLHQKQTGKIASFVCGIVAWKDAIISSDDDGNNLLHIAGKLTPDFQLAHISGAALQMQRDLQWFKEVKGIVPQCYKEYKNVDGETPAQVFTREHKSLQKEAEEWMKKTEESSTVVGVLIITIMFAVAFTVPGGNNQDAGFPALLHEKSFMVFIVSDAIFLFAASTLVLMFLGILTSRYDEKDFLKSLPTKLIIGISTLFVSIAAMMVTFSAVLLIMLQRRMWLVIPIILFGSEPVTLFV